MSEVAKKNFGSFEIPTKVNQAFDLETFLKDALRNLAYGNIPLAYELSRNVYDLMYDKIREDLEKPAKPPLECMQARGWYKQEKERNQGEAIEKYKEYLRNWCHKASQAMYDSDMTIQFRGHGMKSGTG
jgi:hypothetical protein